MTGRMRREREDPGALLTNGVVFLDEIGDLSAAHQAKLLPVLSGGVFYRLGNEASQGGELQYTGTTVAASWRPLSTVLRPDLYSRISANRIRMPALADRMEDFNLILDQLQETVLADCKREIDRMMKVEQKYLDRPYWESYCHAHGGLTESDRKLLATADWSGRGNMRGLTSAVQRILTGGKSAEEALAGLSEAPEQKEHPAALPTLLERLIRRPLGGQGLAGHLRAIEVDQRRELREYLLSNHDAKQRVADALGLDEPTVSQQLHQLDRRRTRGRRKDGK
jgi:DNA-binding NtrC family response regulator